ncbi:hypothetical protein TVAG_235380 [Trichomonas vaginalis G3]|uniref:Uncharacterized protein n=1 Tax=Trichomonas vaginalis (strain ATCC PRA-98 / G3) TaxID=412133 RepID=A2DPQ6_TRIV3|nr:armadillo (ARM) repeat-containing protein family [Trichomonas vaginalis G3]EAY17656.1 hypothetical protein TVAG_235380 [Trichomonas vaginalis G3]KAI5486090.1 armadillo (ARM) repeat-containing protein family [Trichomonas vaginalis G3]|eukprot:XP_001329791.1 hypothetical protein [Trichomonas vaginalis G3]
MSMESRSELFLSVFSRLIESFTSHYHVLTAKYDEALQKGPKVSLSTFFVDIEKNIPMYASIVDSMCSLSKNNTSQSLRNLIEIFANTLILQDPGIFSVLISHTPAVYQSSASAKEVCNYLALYMTTDIIGAIVRKFGTGEEGPMVAKCAYKVCDPSVQFEIHSHILNEWSIILAITSIKNFQESSTPFMAYVDSVNNETLFTLVSKIRLDSCKSLGTTFLEDILNALKILLRRKQLTNNIFACVSSIITTVNFPCDTLQKIFDIAWNEKEEPTVRDGAFELIVTLFQHLPNKEGEANRFFQKRVYAYAGTDATTERDLKLFWRRVMGGYNQLSTDDDLSFIGMTGTNETEMPAIFMTYFFKKSNFAICPQIFRNVLIHLASIDFMYFLHEILQSFLILPLTDYRFIVLLSTIEPINSEEFRKYAVSNVDKKDIDTLNALIRGKVCQNLRILEMKSPKCIPLQILEGMWRRVDQSDQKIGSFLEANGLNKYGALFSKFEVANESEFFSLDVQLLKSLRYILEQGDYLEEGVLKNIIDSCNSSKLQTAMAAYSVATAIVQDPELQIPFTKVLIKNIQNDFTNESVVIVLKFFSILISLNQKSLPNDLLHDIEFYAFIGIVSTQPSTRIIAWNILDAIDELLDHKSISYYIHQSGSTIEKCVKSRLFGTSVHKEETLLQWVLSSRFYDIWLLYIAEFVEIILAANYTPLIQRSNDNLYALLITLDESQKTYSPSLIGYLMMYLGSRVNQDFYLRCPQVYRVALYEPHQANMVTAATTLNVITKLLDGNKSWGDQLAFSAIQHLNIAYAGDVADILSQCTPEKMADASSAFLSLLDSPLCDENIINMILLQALNFLSAMHAVLIKLGASSPRNVAWTTELEKPVIKNVTIAENYCTMITKIITRNIQEEDWSISSRELILRGLLNWAMTKSSVLDNLRKKSKQALATLAKSGPIFGDSVIFDNTVCDIFGEIEFAGNRVLSSLLFYHVQLILTQFCDACLTSNRNYADLFFDSLFVVFTAGSDYNPTKIGCLLLVGNVYEEMQHPRSPEFMEAFTSSVYDGSGGAAETVFSEAFRILSGNSLHMPVKEIINALRRYIPEIRLLPKQSSCTVDSPEKFRIYTPYQFLSALMTATETINEDYITSFFLLWSDLLENPNHEDIVPLFIMQWKNSQIKKRLLLWLIRQDAPFISEKLLSRCSFAYFLHITSQERNFDDQLWVVELLTQSFERRFGSFSNIVALIHFSFLFYKFPQTQPLLQALCRQYDVPIPTSSHDEDLIVTACSFVAKLLEDDAEAIEEWGNEALKWLFGCNELRFASLSLKIYNVLQKPLDNNVISGIIKIMHYYVMESENDPLSLTDLISDSFRFFSNIFTNNELLAFNYASTFIDCPAFPDSCRAASTDIFLKSLNCQATNKAAWSILPSIVRPLLSRIETDDRSRQILEILTKTSSSQELMMIAAPLKETFGGFLFVQPIEALIEKSDVTILCKAIEHYSLMIETASEQLAGSIFKIAALIVNKATNENVREPYARLYKIALNMLGVVPSAMSFVLAIAEHDPCCAIKSTFAFTDWARSIDDVVRALTRIMNPNPIPRSSSIPTLSDTMTLSSVIAMIGNPIVPKVIPFVMQQEIIEGMMRVQRETKKLRRHSSNYIKRYDSSTNVKIQKFIAGDWELRPLEFPKQMMGTSIPDANQTNSLVMGFMEFDAAYSL